MAKNENFKDRNIIFFGDNATFDNIIENECTNDPFEKDEFRKKQREYSDCLLIAYIQSVYCEDTALAWILYSKYNMSYSSIARQLGVVEGTIRKKMNNIKVKISNMTPTNISKLFVKAYDIYTFEKNENDKSSLIPDKEFLISVIQEQLKDNHITNEDKLYLENELKKII